MLQENSPPANVTYHLDDTIQNLEGASKEQIKVFNQWAAVALNKFHISPIEFLFHINNTPSPYIINWDSNFPQDAMREGRNLAENGGISLAMFAMSVLGDYRYVHQTEIGSGVDYGFQKSRPTSDNFLKDCHYIEVSGILSENGTNTIINRVKTKHQQIEDGSNRHQPSSVIVTLFEQPLTIHEKHK